MAQRADKGLVLKMPGGHPVIILTDYPVSANDLVVIVNFTDAQVGAVLFPSGHQLSGGFSFTKDSTAYSQIQEVRRSQADMILTNCIDCGFASDPDVDLIRKHVGQKLDLISSKTVRDHIASLNW